MRIAGTHHFAITTPDLDRLRRFYVDALGFPIVGGFPGLGILFVRAGGTVLELIEDDGLAGGDGRLGWSHLAWEVEDVADAYGGLLALGACPQSPPEDFPADRPALRIAFVRDPDGNLLEVVQPLGTSEPS